MALLTRITAKLFGGTATNIGQFGSGQVGTKVLTTNPTTLQALSNWLGGWSSSVLGANKFPPIEEMNAVNYVQSYLINYLYQEGIPEYDSGTLYSQWAIVKKPGTFQLFGSLVTNNTGNALPTAPASNSSWQFLFDFASSSQFNTWTYAGFSPGTTYTAATAGIVTAYGTEASVGGQLNALTDTNSPPTTNVLSTQISGAGTGGIVCLTFPVRKGDKWMVTTSSVTVTAINFLSVGT